MSREGDHELGHAAKVGVGLECALDTNPGPTLESGPGPTLWANLRVMLGLTVKAALIATHGAYIPGPQMNLCLEEE